MRNIITGISVKDINATPSNFSPLEIIPATGWFRRKSKDGQREEIELSQKLRWADQIPPILSKELVIQVSYIDEENGMSYVLTLGSEDVPAQIEVEDEDVRTITCNYTRLI